MTLNKQTEHIDKHKTQVVLLDASGDIFESCDSIFDTQSYIGKSIKNICYFFESEMDSIVNSKATKITFEKIKIASEILPGCYDFIFSKQELKGSKVILWEIFDYTKIYEEYTFVQQLQNELEILEQFDNRPDILNINKSKFFQEGYTANEANNVSQLLNNLKRSRFEDFYAKVDSPNSPFTEFRTAGLKSCVNELILDINTFVKHLRKIAFKPVEVSSFLNSVSDLFLSIDLNNEVPSSINMDKKLVKKILHIIALEKDQASINNNIALEVGYIEMESNNTYLTLIWKTKAAQALTSASALVKMSSLQSLLAMIDGALDLSFESNDSVLVSKIIIPTK